MNTTHKCRAHKVRSHTCFPEKLGMKALSSRGRVHFCPVPPSSFILLSAKFLIIFFLPNFSSIQKLVHVKSEPELPLALLTGTCFDRKRGDFVENERMTQDFPLLFYIFSLRCHPFSCLQQSALRPDGDKHFARANISFPI